MGEIFLTKTYQDKRTTISSTFLIRKGLRGSLFKGSKGLNHECPALNGRSLETKEYNKEPDKGVGG